MLAQFCLHSIVYKKITLVITLRYFSKCVLYKYLVIIYKIKYFHFDTISYFIVIK